VLDRLLTRFQDLPDYVVAAAIVGILSAVAGFIEWIDRRTDPPIMRTRINDASDQFLLGRGSALEAGYRSVRDFFDHIGS
jgi:hypothetical protein